ncbi:hypothetical protein H9P43_007270 [Blastocladiella emersonii ATCC 22665]|nr:hypothetical protein H9P43_007270 [Blastocladiella emersonii ATCC 22665]
MYWLCGDFGTGKRGTGPAPSLLQRNDAILQRRDLHASARRGDLLAGVSPEELANPNDPDFDASISGWWEQYVKGLVPGYVLKQAAADPPPAKVWTVLELTERLLGLSSDVARVLTAFLSRIHIPADNFCVCPDPPVALDGVVLSTLDRRIPKNKEPYTVVTDLPSKYTRASRAPDHYLSTHPEFHAMFQALGKHELVLWEPLAQLQAEVKHPLLDLLFQFLHHIPGTGPFFLAELPRSIPALAQIAFTLGTIVNPCLQLLPRATWSEVRKFVDDNGGRARPGGDEFGTEFTAVLEEHAPIMRDVALLSHDHVPHHVAVQSLFRTPARCTSEQFDQLRRDVFRSILDVAEKTASTGQGIDGLPLPDAPPTSSQVDAAAAAAAAASLRADLDKFSAGPRAFHPKWYAIALHEMLSAADVEATARLAQPDVGNRDALTETVAMLRQLLPLLHHVLVNLPTPEEVVAAFQPNRPPTELSVSPLVLHVVSKLHSIPYRYANLLDSLPSLDVRTKFLPPADRYNPLIQPTAARPELEMKTLARVVAASRGTRGPVVKTWTWYGDNAQLMDAPPPPPPPPPSRNGRAVRIEPYTPPPGHEHHPLKELAAYGMCFPNHVPIRVTPVHAGGMTKADSACSKEAKDPATCGAGVLAWWYLSCRRSIGFSIMRRAEAPHQVYATLLSRFRKMPPILVYDNACNVADYCLGRFPAAFRDTLFLVDELHMPGHVNCAPSFRGKLYRALADVPTILHEQKNSQIAGLKSIAPKASYPLFSNLLLHRIAMLNEHELEKDPKYWDACTSSFTVSPVDVEWEGGEGEVDDGDDDEIADVHSE